MEVRKLVIETVEQAHQHKFASSPTIRINGRDVVFDTAENHCESCTDLSGCDEGVDCRIWSYQGEEYTEAPVGFVVEVILRKVFGGPSDSEDDAIAFVGVPENLQRFFKSKSSVTGTQSCCGDSTSKKCSCQ